MRREEAALSSGSKSRPAIAPAGSNRTTSSSRTIERSSGAPNRTVWGARRQRRARASRPRPGFLQGAMRAVARTPVSNHWMPPGSESSTSQPGVRASGRIDSGDLADGSQSALHLPPDRRSLLQRMTADMRPAECSIVFAGSPAGHFAMSSVAHN